MGNGGTEIGIAHYARPRSFDLFARGAEVHSIHVPKRIEAGIRAIERGGIDIVGDDVDAGKGALEGNLRTQHTGAGDHDACNWLAVD